MKRKFTVSTHYAENMGEIPWPERYLHLAAHNFCNLMHQTLTTNGKFRFSSRDYDARLVAVLMDYADKNELKVQHIGDEVTIYIEADT